MLRVSMTLCFLCIGASSQATEATIGFNGLPWGAPEQQIAEKFAGKIKESCDFTSSITGKLVRETCSHPIIEPYEVVGLPFRLDLYLDDARRLERVDLVYLDWEHKSQTSFSNWLDTYQRLQAALMLKYGKPDRLHVYNGDIRAGAAFAESQRGAEWITPNTEVELITFHHPERDTASYMIKYRRGIEGDANRL